MKLRVLIALFALLSLATSAFAAEQRCTELGANCICSEPLDTTSFPLVVTAYYDPADSVTQECELSPGNTGSAIQRNVADFFGDDDATAKAALPPGNTISHFLRGPESHGGTFYIGNWFQFSGQPTKRVAMRFYIYRSPNFEFANEGICNNGKFVEFHSGFVGDSSFGPVHTYPWGDDDFAFVNTGTQDCCVSGPGNSGNNLTKDDWRGKWWRWEWIIINRNSTGVSPNGWMLYAYAKNITDDTPEVLVIDSQSGLGSLPIRDDREPVENSGGAPVHRTTRKMLVNFFRSANNPPTLQCQGWEGLTHYMVAAWNTDAGQRIGAAVEVEGQVINEVVSTGVSISSGAALQ